MEITLPEKFLQRMKSLLNDDYEAFINEYTLQPLKGLRVNTLKCTADKLQQLLDVKLTPSPFSPLSYYIEGNIKLGNNPLHHCGAYYLQEPSASCAVTALDIQQGDKVLDLCAAPGGKSTQIATLLNGTGLIWSNEIVKKRAQILLSNIERMGIKNSVVSSLSPEVLCPKLQGYFDKVLVDAPCSGEGMFRKDAQAITEWTEEHTKSCMERQLQILESAKLCLKEGGVLVYSTCTFSPYENEGVINEFIKNNPDFTLVDCLQGTDIDFGRAGIDMPQARRIYPMDGGEGHFVAKLIKQSEATGYTANEPEENPKTLKANANIIKQANQLYQDIFKGLNTPIFTVVNDKIIIKPKETPILAGTGVIRSGILFGEIKKNRIEPAHNIFTTGCKDDFNNVVDLDVNSPQINSYLLGEEISVNDNIKGYTAVCVNGITLGFGKCSNGQLKNKYPKGLRKVK
ncbi:MAG: RsmB/NOP family class I SAM-dependent RNA methyltransferase [Acutalibacteraceae bacterium]|nr:RsmB/NOP family class I SAM-dependent RNA methyltransferase [Acutalibacteraceae bacterium]